MTIFMKLQVALVAILISGLGCQTTTPPPSSASSATSNFPPSASEEIAAMERDTSPSGTRKLVEALRNFPITGGRTDAAYALEKRPSPERDRILVESIRRQAIRDDDDRWLVVRAFKKAQDNQAIGLLQEVTVKGDPTSAILAMERLLEADPSERSYRFWIRLIARLSGDPGIPAATTGQVIAAPFTKKHPRAKEFYGKATKDLQSNKSVRALLADYSKRMETP